LASAAIVSGELTASLSSGQEGLTLEQRLGAERTPVLFPDLPLSSALPHFQRWPLLPITNRAIRGSLEGVVSLQDVLNRYQQQKGLNHN
jgi:chloride channel protein, CIC family